MYRWGILLVLIAALVFGGKNLYLGGAFEKTTNLQKVPQEVAQICNIITEQKEEGEQIRLAATSLVATYVRVYDPSIVMPYGRDGKGCANGVDRRLYEMLMSYEPDLEKEIQYARKNSWNYLAHWSENGETVDVFEKAGYACLGKVGKYFIFKDIS